MIVLDASICAPWFLSDEESDESQMAEARLQRDGAVVPGLWNLEIRNLLLMAHRRNRIDRRELDFLLPRVSRLPVDVDLNARMHVVMDLALRHHLTVYDALYLELAMRRRLPLATLDRKLAKAAGDENVLVLG